MASLRQSVISKLWLTTPANRVGVIRFLPLTVAPCSVVKDACGSNADESTIVCEGRVGECFCHSFMLLLLYPPRFCFQTALSATWVAPRNDSLLIFVRFHSHRYSHVSPPTHSSKPVWKVPVPTPVLFPGSHEYLKTPLRISLIRSTKPQVVAVGVGKQLLSV